uniref:Uncharacterized protein n=1 Tax=Zosterops lateralis melanops TaxID=1220523 RepID=A0A8D2PBE3_ZOSLA
MGPASSSKPCKEGKIPFPGSTEHTAPYGLGSPPRRRKRSAGRCQCSRSRDSTCATFCQDEGVDFWGTAVPFPEGRAGTTLGVGTTEGVDFWDPSVPCMAQGCSELGLSSQTSCGHLSLWHMWGLS